VRTRISESINGPAVSPCGDRRVFLCARLAPEVHFPHVSVCLSFRLGCYHGETSVPAVIAIERSTDLFIHFSGRVWKL
jgi:hypothetical protein